MEAQMHFAIIGAGMAGLACADALSRAGHKVMLFDKGRGAGGRMSTKRMASPLGEVSFDHGAQYFTVRNPRFEQVVGGMFDLGLVAHWSAVASDAWIGVPGMNAVIKHMAADHDVRWGHSIKAMVRHEGKWLLISDAGEINPFDAAILALPAEQAAPILSLHDFDMARSALNARSQPCWTGMFVFDQPLANLPDIIRDTGDIGWAARNSAKPGRAGPEAWVVQATATWSQTHLEAPQEQIAAMLRDALSQMAGQALPQPIASTAHRWRYALSAGTGAGALWNADMALGVCGDWLLGPRVECAWLSGTMLGERINAGRTAAAASGLQAEAA
jgi:predicted NAD/FAD-dependent oxidoreductase